jgi:hypothetical protein
MTKEQRKAVWDKFGHRCSYCGNPLPYEKMQVDHFHPKMMSHFVGMDNVINEPTGSYFGIEIQDINEFKNLMPACRKCNFYKSAERISVFRSKIETMIQRLEKIFIFNLAVNFGIIKQVNWDGKFFYEKYLEHPEEYKTINFEPVPREPFDDYVQRTLNETRKKTGGYI